MRGLSGLSLASRGASVTLTDEHPGALELARRNAALNNLTDAVRVESYACGAEVHVQNRVDLVVASDVLYEAWQIPPLVASLKALLASRPPDAGSGSRPVALLGLPRRKSSLFGLQQLRDALSSAALEVSAVRVEQMPSALPRREADDFVVLKMQAPRRAAGPLLLPTGNR